MLSPRFIPLLAGLALGAGGAWVVRHELTPTHAGTPPPSASGNAGNTSSASAPARSSTALLLPPRLAADEAGAALDAWLASTAAPAEYAAKAVALRALLTVLPDELFPRLLNALIARDGDDARRFRQTAFDIWNERSSADAARWAAETSLTKHFDAHTRDRLARQAAKTWAQIDFTAAYAWAAGLADLDLSRMLSGVLLAQLTATEPARALALAQDRGLEFLQATQSDLFAAWADVDPAAAVHALGRSILDADKDDWRLRQALGAWVGRDARAAVDWILAQPSDSSKPWDSLLRNITWQVGENPAALRPFADALLARSDSPSRFGDLSSLLATWKRKDPDAALAWVKTLPDAAQRADLIEDNIYETDPNLKNPDRILPFALELPPGPVRDQKISGLLANWARTDPDAALAWLRAHDDPSLASAAERVQGALVGALAATDPAAALAAWGQLPSAESRAAAIPALATAWTKTDPAGAARWMFDQLPTRPSFDRATFDALTPEAQAQAGILLDAYHRQREVFANAASAWFAKDPLAALAWAEALPDEQKRKTALENLGSYSAPFGADVPDPTDRAALLSNITDPALRDQVLATHLRQWMRSDLPSARAWIESNDALSAEQAAQLLTESGAPSP